jgi:copper transport protein
VSTWRRLGCIAVLCVATVCVAQPASAHANLLSSDPQNGATLDAAPVQITITFSEKPDPGLSQLILYDAGGSDTRAIGEPTAQGDRKLAFPVTGDVSDGVYTAAWTTISVEDGHPTSGVFTFGVGVSAPATPSAGVPPSRTSGPTPLSVISKSLLYAGLMLLVAIAVVGMGVFGGAPRARPQVGMWAAAAGLVGALGFVWAQQRATGASAGTYLSSEAARNPIALLAVTLVAAILAVVAARAPQRWLPWGAGAAAAIALSVRAHGGHAAAAPLPVLAQAEQWVHTVAGACWAGGLVLLVLLIHERRSDPPVALARGYSAVALAAIAVVVATGVLRAVAELGGLDDVVHLWRSSYGRTLTIKVAIVLAVVVLGAVNRYRSIARLDRDAHPLLRIAGAELVAAAGIIALTATLTSFPPPVGATPPQTQPLDAVTMTGNDFGTTVQASITVSPGQSGSQNTYRATFTRYGTNELYPAEAARLQLRSVTRPDLPGSTIRLNADGERWTAQALDPSIAGTFLVTAQLQTDATVVQIPMTLITRSAGQITTTPAPGGETVATATFADGVRVQATSSGASPTQIHVTAFGPDGNEFAVQKLVIVGTPVGGRPSQLSVERFTEGHFAASPTLEAGTWTFDAVATAAGTAYQVTWSSTVAG